MGRQIRKWEKGSRVGLWKERGQESKQGSLKPRINKWVRLRESQEPREIGSSFFILGENQGILQAHHGEVSCQSWALSLFQRKNEENFWNVQGEPLTCIRAVWYEGDPFTFGRELRKSAHACNWRLASQGEGLSRGPKQSMFWKDAGTRSLLRCRTCLAPWRMGKNTCPCWRAKGSLDSGRWDFSGRIDEN